MSSDRTGSIAGIVLAAGASSRMGRNKLLFEIDGETLLRRSVRQAMAAGLDPVIVVLGHDAERNSAAIADLSCVTAENPDYALGASGSIRVGINVVPPETDAAVVILADMPMVTTDMLRTLVSKYRGSAAPLVVSEYGEVNAPPMLYDRSLFGELLAMDGDSCGKQVVKRHRQEAVRVPWPADTLTDVDVPADFDRVKALLANAGV